MAQKGNLDRIHWLWLLVPAVVAAEVFLQWSIPSADPSKEEWAKAAQAVIDQKQDGDLVVIAPSWATQGRIYLKPVIALRDFGRFETSTYDRIIEVSLNGERAPETEGLVLESEQDIGKISVCRYRTGGSAKILFDFLDETYSLKAGGDKLKGAVLIIDHWFNPRLVVPFKPRKTPASRIYKGVPLNGVIHGYAVIGYREGRFNKGGPIKLEIFVNDEKVGEQMINNFGPLEPFDIPINREGTGTVRFQVTSDDHFKRRFGLAADMRVGAPE